MGFYFQDDMYEAVNALPKRAKEQVVTAIVTYYFEGVEPKLSGASLAVFTALKKRIDMARVNAERQKRNRDKNRDSNASVTRQYRDKGVSLLLREGDREVITDVITTPQTPQGDEVWGASDETAEFIAESLKAYNDATGQDVRDMAPSTMESLARIMRRGRTIDDIRAVASHKAAQWRGDTRMARFVRPSTLFGDKFEEYLAETREVERDGERYSKYD